MLDFSMMELTAILHVLIISAVYILREIFVVQLLRTK